ncbi:MAG TPA: hypothetical protein VFN10_08625 [Thermoanaerobaculia bacterium]|nr:hypothetical protein [Thermoanaerobaculia bacterium]
MNGLLFTILWFPLLGLAVSRLTGRAPIFLLGVGTCGFVLFVAGVLGAPLVPVLIVLGLAAIAVLLSRKALERRGLPRWSLLPGEASPAAPLFLALIPAAALLFISAVTPLSDYDGRAFWLLKAKALAHEGVVGGPFFHGATISPRNAYPLLLPLDGATIMLAAGELDEQHVRWLYSLIALSFALLLGRRLQWWCAPLFLLLPQVVLMHQGSALTAYSDLAVGAFTACAFFELLDGESPLRFGLWIAFIAMTKSEGLPLSALLFAIGAIVFRRRIVVALAPYAIAVGTVLAWRRSVPLSDEMDFASLIRTVPQHLPQLRACIAAIAGEFADLQDWGVLWLAFVAAMLVLLARREWRLPALAAAVIVPMLALYAAVYAVSPYDLPTLSGDLAPRILTHLLGPAFAVISGAFARSR